jgi:4-azaleucine resistance transporter AzlC
MSSPRSEFTSGAKAIAPGLLGAITFATIWGMVAVDTGIPAPLALAMSVIVNSGGVQMVAVQLMGAKASPVVIILTAFVINLRFAMFSASLAPHFAGLPQRWKNLIAYLLTDLPYMISVTRFYEAPQRAYKHWFYLGAALPLWATWQLSTMAGVLLGAQIPESWSLDFAIPLTFIGIAVPAIKDNAAVVAAVSAGLIATLAANLPFNLGLIVASVVGVLVGMLFKRK